MFCNSRYSNRPKQGPPVDSSTITIVGDLGSWNPYLSLTSVVTRVAFEGRSLQPRLVCHSGRKQKLRHYKILDPTLGPKILKHFVLPLHYTFRSNMYNYVFFYFSGKKVLIFISLFTNELEFIFNIFESKNFFL